MWRQCMGCFIFLRLQPRVGVSWRVAIQCDIIGTANFAEVATLTVCVVL